MFNKLFQDLQKTDKIKLVILIFVFLSISFLIIWSGEKIEKDIEEIFKEGAPAKPQLTISEESKSQIVQEGVFLYRVTNGTNDKPAKTIYGIVITKDKGERILEVQNAGQTVKVKINPNTTFKRLLFDKTGRPLSAPEYIGEDPFEVIKEGDTVALGLLKEIDPKVSFYEASIIVLTNKPTIIGGVVGEIYKR